MTLYPSACSNSRTTDQIFIKFYIGRIYLKFADVFKFCFKLDDDDDDDDDENSSSNIDNNKTTATTASTMHAV